VGYEGRLMRLAESVAREDFLKNYQGSELDPRWLKRVSKLSAKGWKSLVARDKDRVKQHRHEIQMLAGETGLEIGQFRKIVQMVQKGEREARHGVRFREYASVFKLQCWRLAEASLAILFLEGGAVVAVPFELRIARAVETIRVRRAD
jgi:hypothetical protein